MTEKELEARANTHSNIVETCVWLVENRLIVADTIEDACSIYRERVGVEPYKIEAVRDNTLIPSPIALIKRK